MLVLLFHACRALLFYEGRSFLKVNINIRKYSIYATDTRIDENRQKSSKQYEDITVIEYQDGSPP